MLVCSASPQWFLCSSWWCVDTEDDKEGTSGHRSLQIKWCGDSSTDFIVKPFSFTITYVDPDVAGKWVADNNTQLFSWHWPGDNESILPIVMPIVDTTILLIVNAAITGLLDPSRKIREIWGCWEEPNGDGGPNARNVTPIISTMYIGPGAAHKPPRYSGSLHQCFRVLPDAPRPPWSLAMCSQTVQEHSQVLLKAPAVMEVHSACYEIDY